MLTPDDVRGFFQPIQFRDGQETLILSDIFLARMEGTHIAGNFDLDPDYQRGHVWSQEQQEAFIGHLLEGGAAPLVICNRIMNGPKGWVDEVVDGKQRLTAMYRWRKGQIAGVLTDGRRIHVDDLDADARRWLCGLTGLRVTVGYVLLDRPEVLRLYLRLNRGGTVHTEAEIAHVRALLDALDTPKKG